MSPLEHQVMQLLFSAKGSLTAEFVASNLSPVTVGEVENALRVLEESKWADSFEFDDARVAYRLLEAGREECARLEIRTIPLSKTKSQQLAGRIRELRSEGMSLQEIANAVGCSYGTVQAICAQGEQ
jgi:DNA-binding PadR family transcriptional regulator